MSAAHSGAPARRLVASSVTVLAVLLGLLGPGLVPAASAAPSAPTGLSASADTIPTLSWNRVAGATKYRVQGSENSSFSGTVFNVETVNTTYVPTRVFKSGTLYWRVQATDASGSSGYSFADFTVPDIAAPANLDVSPGERVLPPVSPPVIEWDAVTGAIGYDVQLDAEGDETGSILKSNIKTTTYVWPDPQAVENYFVRVRAKFDNELQTEWSDWVEYDVDDLPAVTSATCAAEIACAPAPVTGARPSVTLQDLVLDWDPVRGAQKYEVRVALDDDFNTLVERIEVYGTGYSPEITYDNDDYFWQVRAINAAGDPTDWPAESSTFKRDWPQRPSLVYPADTVAVSVADDLYFQWTPARHATRYQLDVGTSPSFTPESYETCETAATTYAPGYRRDKCMPSQGATYYWRVRAMDEPQGVQGLYSPIRTFTYDSGAVTKVSPANGATGVTVPTLRWEPSTDAARYEVMLRANGGRLIDSESTYGLSWTVEEKLNPVDNPFSWTVVAIDSDGQRSPQYPARTFNVSGDPIPGGVSPLEPLPGESEVTTSRFPLLRWQPMDGAAYYRLKVSETPGMELPNDATRILDAKLPYPAVTDTSAYFLSPRVRTWWVEAYTAGDLLIDEGPEATFTIARPDEVQGRAIALDGQTFDAPGGSPCTIAIDGGTSCPVVPSTPVLDWDPVVGAGGYMVYLAEDPNMTNLVLEPTVTYTQNSRWTPTTLMAQEALADNQAGQAYYWFVRPCISVDPFVNCGPDPESVTDSATNAFRKVSPPVQLTSPASGAGFGDDVTFTWTDYAVTNQATTYPGGLAPSHQTGMRYRIQVAQSQTITDVNAIDDQIVDQATYTAYTDTYPEGDLWWRVQAIDAQSNRLTWSETRPLKRAAPATNLDPNVAAGNERPGVDPGAYPTFNSHVPSGAVPFAWTAHEFDGTWQIEVYRNDDTAASSANRMLGFPATTKQSAFIGAALLPASSQPYRWRIRRTDVDAKLGAWSDFGRFYVDPALPVLVSPSDGSAQLPNGSVLDWDPLPGAASYRVEVSSADGGSSPGTVTTSATAWAPTTSLTTGTYTWRITGLDTSGNALGSSARTFTVNTGLTAVSGPQVLAPEGTGVGSTLTSVPPTWSQAGVTTTYQWLRGGSAISGATGTTYTLTTADFGKSISLRATGKLAGYTDSTAVSNAFTCSTGGALATTAPPVLSGNPAVGSTLSSTAGTWSQPSTTITYQWMRDGAPIPGATKSSYKLVAADAGRSVSAAVTATKAAFDSGTATTLPITVGKLSSTTAVSLSASKVKPKKKVKITVEVTVAGVPGPTGTVKFLDGTKVIKNVSLSSSRGGTVTLSWKKFKKGKHKIKAVFSGSPTTTGSTSKLVKLVVKR